MTSNSSKCKSPVNFFKFIPPGCISKVSIPIAFRKYLKRIRKTKHAILRRGNQSWPVEINDDWVFADGWEDFAKENGVKDLNLVVFKHDGNMVFDTMVFDLTWCEIEYPTQDIVTEKKAKTTENSEAKSSRKCIIDTSTLKKTAKEMDSYKNKSTESLVLLEAEETTIHEDTHYPCFTGIVKSKYRLYLPTSFTTPNELSVGEMILRNDQTKTKRSWRVNVEISLGKYYTLVRGWNDFRISNGVKEGDSFKFELVKNGITPEAVFYQLPQETIKGKVVRNPYFKSIVTSCGISDSYVDIPMKFARSNGLVNRNCESVVMDENRRLWPTSICSTSESRLCIRGLRDIWAANGLEEGDKFLLELFDVGMKPLINLHGMRSHPLFLSAIKDGNETNI